MIWDRQLNDGRGATNKLRPMETPAPIAKAIPNAMPLGATGRSGTGRWPATTFVAPKVTRKKMSARTAANALPTGSFGTAANGQRNQVITTSAATVAAKNGLRRI